LLVADGFSRHFPPKFSRRIGRNRNIGILSACFFEGAVTLEHRSVRVIFALTVEVIRFPDYLHGLVGVVSGIVVLVESWSGDWQAFWWSFRRLRSVNLWLFLFAFSAHIVDLAAEGCLFVSLVEDVAYYN